jgi:hypothetical protein
LGILKCASSELVEVELGGESRRNECRGPWNTGLRVSL